MTTLPRPYGLTHQLARATAPLIYSWRLVRGGMNPPPVRTEVMTKVDEGDDKPRMQQTLVYWKGLWWVPDMSVYVYYTPTHWAPLND